MTLNCSSNFDENVILQPADSAEFTGNRQAISFNGKPQATAPALGSHSRLRLAVKQF
jgi:hypothetical protein